MWRVFIHYAAGVLIALSFLGALLFWEWSCDDGWASTWSVCDFWTKGQEPTNLIPTKHPYGFEPISQNKINVESQQRSLHVRYDEVCKRLMTIPGVGPVVALTYRATVDLPSRFRNSKAVGAVFGLTPSKHQSGESDRTGGISRCGDEMMRTMLYEAAQILLVRSTKWSWLKAWAMQIARRRGMKKAIVALARRLAVIMHRIWVDGTEFRWTREVAAA